MEILIGILAALAGVIGTLSILAPKILALMVTVEKLTPEGTAVDSALDRLIVVFGFIGKYASVANASMVQDLADRLKARSEPVE